jgi:acyl-CoA dehydrogenase
MTFRITPEQAEFAERLEATLKLHASVPHIQALDNAAAFPSGLHRELAEFGVFGLGIAAKNGGFGGSSIEQVLALRALGTHANAIGVFATVQYLLTSLLRDYGITEQKKRWLAPLAKGELKGSFCLTENGSGTDILASLETVASKTKGGWRLKGRKRWVSGAMDCDLLIVVARTSKHRTRGMTMFIVPRNLPGIDVKRIETFAIKSYEVCEVEFNNVELQTDAVVGKVGEAFSQIIGNLNSERISAAAVATGIGMGALQQAVAYAKERQAFGRPLGQFQALQHRLVRSSVELECAWLMVLRAATDYRDGNPVDVGSSMAKLAASSALKVIVQIGMEVMGANGFETSHPMQRYYRDSRLYAIAPLADDMNINLIGERWLGLPRSF